MADKIPPVTSGLVYTYLAGHVRRQSTPEGGFRALKRGYIHWASGRVEKIDNHPEYCHVRSTMKPSMKQGSYRVYLLLKNGKIATVVQATCQCAAGESASCTHVSALLHALAGLAPSTFSLKIQEGCIDDEEDSAPVTSRLCKWNVPRKRKDSAMPMSTAVFEKHDYSKTEKRKLKSLDEFDPRPPEFRGTAASRLPTLLNNIRGQQLCISLLFDEKCQHNPEETQLSQTSSDTNVPDLDTLKQTISSFKDSLRLTDDQIREIEQATREQRVSPRWYSERRFRITASKFGTILHRKESTPPDKLVIQLLQQKFFTSPALQYGITQEPIAMAECVGYQHSHGHTDLTVCPSGFIVCSAHPYLGASPDGAVYDPSDAKELFGFLEIKCPFTARNVYPTEACLVPGFCCTLDKEMGCLKLKENHSYYAQIQGQMAIGCRPWCDFVIYTSKGISVQRIKYDEQYWKNTLLPKLTSFYDNCMTPEIVSPVHALGLPLRNLSKL